MSSELLRNTLEKVYEDEDEIHYTCTPEQAEQCLKAERLDAGGEDSRGRLVVYVSVYDAFFAWYKPHYR
jgi:hypothetical protein